MAQQRHSRPRGAYLPKADSPRPEKTWCQVTSVDADSARFGAGTGVAVFIAQVAAFAGLDDAVAATGAEFALGGASVVGVVVVGFAVIAFLAVGGLEFAVAAIGCFEAAVHAASGFAVGAVSAGVEGVAIFVAAEIAGFAEQGGNDAVAA